MADRCSDGSSSGGTSDESSSSDATDNSSNAKRKKRLSVKNKSRRPKTYSYDNSSPEAGVNVQMKSNSDHKSAINIRKHRKQESDNSSDSLDDNSTKKKRRSSSDEEVEKKPLRNSGEHHLRDESEIRERIKQRYIKREEEDGHYNDNRERHHEYDKRRNYDDNGGYERDTHEIRYKQERDIKKEKQYDSNDGYIKNNYKYKHEIDIKKEEQYNEDEISDHRKRKNEYRQRSPDSIPERKSPRRNKRERGDRNENGDHRRHNDNNHRRNENIENNREWDIGKNEFEGRDRDNSNHRHGEGIDRNRNESTKDSKPKKEEVDYKLSGKLTEYTNTYNGVVIMYNEPAEARKPKTKWRFYPFKGEKALTMLQLHRQSAFLLGRDRKVADIPVDHPSCSKQHAVFQFRLVPYERADGSMGKRVRPYIIDLDSRNGTHVNNNRIDARRYVELKEKDVIKFGFSSRDYVLLHEKSQDVDSSEDEGVKEIPVKTEKEKKEKSTEK